MRTVTDRIRHALAFEGIGLVLIILLAPIVLNKPMEAIGLLAIAGSVIATLWTYVFTLGFDRVLLRLRGTTARTLVLRVVYSLLFEAGLIAVLLPITAYVLGIGLFEALLVDIGLAVFYIVYSFIYNIIYDRIFPDPGATVSQSEMR